MNKHGLTDSDGGVALRLLMAERDLVKAAWEAVSDQWPAAQEFPVRFDYYRRTWGKVQTFAAVAVYETKATTVDRFMWSAVWRTQFGGGYRSGGRREALEHWRIEPCASAESAHGEGCDALAKMLVGNGAVPDEATTDISFWLADCNKKANREGELAYE